MNDSIKHPAGAGGNRVSETRGDIPQELAEMLVGMSWERETSGCSGTDIYRIHEAPLYGKCVYLKMAQCDAGRSDLLSEKDVLAWLEDKLPVPKIHYFGEQGDQVYLLISEIKGLDATDASFVAHPQEMVVLLAEGLKMIHDVDIAGCPFDQRLNSKIEEAGRRVSQGLVDEADFEPIYRRQTAYELYDKVMRTRPDHEDLVFTHGDYCLPNIIIDQGEISGFIDWGRGGIADRYQDLALAARSLRHNLGDAQWVDLFFKTYGLTSKQEAKIDYYILLDELF